MPADQLPSMRVCDAAVDQRRDGDDSLAACPACHSRAWAPLLDAYDFHYGNSGRFHLVKCVGCGLWSLSPMPSAEQLAASYPDDYYSFQEPRSGMTPKRRLAAILGLERRTYLPDATRPGRILDVGCGSGAYIAELARRGWEVAGVEPGAAAAATGRKNGLDITTGSIHDVRFPPQHFDVVRFNHSFEHIPDPVDVLHVAHGLLKPQGALFIGVPNTAGIWARLFRSYWWYVGAPVHTYGYDTVNLEKLAAAAGFETERIRYYSEYAGLLGSLQIWANRNKTPRLSSGRIIESKLLRLPALWLCRGLDLIQQGDCIEYIGRPRGESRAD